MTNKTIAPYGSWKSPVTSELIVADSISIGDVVLVRRRHLLDRDAPGG